MAKRKRASFLLRRLNKITLHLDCAKAPGLWRNLNVNVILFNLLIGIFCLVAAWSWSTERKPWTGNVLEFEWRGSLLYQTYPSVNSNRHLIKHSADDLFLDTSLSNAYAEYGIEIEMAIADTHKQHLDIDFLRLTGRYVWFDELIGDPFTFTFGLSLTQSFYRSLHDIGSFHHGRHEIELFASLGKEQIEEVNWGAHWWGVVGFGVAERGSPWLRGELAYAYRLYPQHELGCFARSLWGLGRRRLHITDFDGYGSVNHQSIDLGVNYTYLIEYFGSLSIEYSGRVYTRNFPAYAQHILLRVLYTFGL